MGIDSLNKFLRDKYPDVYKEVHLSAFAFKKVPFDISSFIYKFISSYGKEQNKWLNAFIKMILLCRQNAVNLIPIFDGKAPPEKDEERFDRGEQKDKGDVKCFQLRLDLSRYKNNKTTTPELIQLMRTLLIKKHNEDIQYKMKRLLRPPKETKEEEFKIGDDIEIDVDMINTYLEGREKNIFNITSEDLTLLKTLLNKFKIPYFEAPDEAEALANYLVKTGLADATFSLDSDCIAYQVPVLINELDVYTGICRVVYFDDLCEQLELTPDEVRLLCISLGCDYSRHTKTIKGVGPVTAHKMIKKWKTYEGLKKNEKKFQVEDDGLRHDKCVELFSLKYPAITSVPIWDLRIDIEEITDWLTANHLYCDKAKLKQYWKPPPIVFADDE